MTSRRFQWIAFAALLAAPPLFFEGGFALTLASQAGIAIILALSYNMLLGQTGLLSFGHAVYAGLGAYAAIHAMKLIGAGSLPFPVALLPLIGAVAGGTVAVLLGYVSSRRGGLTFAMISLGIGEMVHAAAALFPALFGGESGITADRAGMRVTTSVADTVAIAAQLGLDFSSAHAVCWLIAAWTLASALAMYGFTRTPLGRLANAVRDNPERAAQIGVDPRRVRWLVMIAAGAFAGIAGSLSAILFEIVSAENLGTPASVAMLIAAFIGGTGAFFGPVAGALVYTLMSSAVAAVTPAWPMYLGALFILIVLKAPGGLASILVDARQSGIYGRFGSAVMGLSVVSALAVLAGFVGLVESAYALAGSPGTAAGWLATLPGGRATGVVLSAALLMAGREIRHRLAARRPMPPNAAALPEHAA